MANHNPKGNRYTSENQPRKRGRKKSVFGPLEKENNLSLDDVRKVYKNILIARNFSELDKVKEKYPSLITEMTIDMLKQDKVGRLTGRKQKITYRDKESGEDVSKEVDERVKSYETVQYMLDRIYGTPTKIDLDIAGSIVYTDELTREENDKRILELMRDLGYEQGKTE